MKALPWLELWRHTGSGETRYQQCPCGSGLGAALLTAVIDFFFESKKESIIKDRLWYEFKSNQRNGDEKIILFLKLCNRNEGADLLNLHKSKISDFPLGGNMAEMSDSLYI